MLSDEQLIRLDFYKNFEKSGLNYRKTHSFDFNG